MNKYDIVFSVAHLKSLVDDNKQEEAKAYIKKFYFNGINSSCIFFYNGLEESFTSLVPKDAIATIPSEIDNEKKKGHGQFTGRNFLKSVDFMEDSYTPTIDFNKPPVFTTQKKMKGLTFECKYLNMARPLPFDTQELNDIDEENEEIKKGVEMILTHIRTAWCSDNMEQFNYVLNFLAHTIGGRKVRKAIYMQTGEGIGKGVIIDMLKQILGERMHKTNNIETILHYTKPLEGRLLINVDEMPHNRDFRATSDKMKSLVTERVFDCRKMHAVAYEQVNTFNFIVSTNNDALMFSENNNRRYFFPDISERYKGNFPYFIELTKFTENRNVQLAFYKYLLERFEETKDWNEDVMPQTKAKNSKMIEALPKIYKYLKEEYLLKNQDLKIRTNYFFEEYFKATGDKGSKLSVGKKLKEIDIIPKKVRKGNQTYYEFQKSHNDLMKEYQTRNWIDEDIDVVEVTNDLQDMSIVMDDDEHNELLAKAKQADELKQRNKELLLELARVRGELNALKHGGHSNVSVEKKEEKPKKQTQSIFDIDFND